LRNAREDVTRIVANRSKPQRIVSIYEGIVALRWAIVTIAWWIVPWLVR
jgi:hypothetical protein